MLYKLPCTFRRFIIIGVTLAVSSVQAAPRHTGLSTYCCFLPDLTGFMDSRCAGPRRQHHLLRSDPTIDKPLEGIRPR
jgi:hypothetical protein